MYCHIKSRKSMQHPETSLLWVNTPGDKSLKS